MLQAHLSPYRLNEQYHQLLKNDDKHLCPHLKEDRLIRGNYSYDLKLNAELHHLHYQ